MIRRPLFIAAIAALLVGALAAPAFAHVTAKADNPTPGGFSKITFRVPNEEDAASTTELSVQLPADHPIASVSVKPKDGWSYTIVKAPLSPPVQTDDGELTESVSTITWTGGSIAPGEFDEFEISAGPLPTGTDSLVFKALQTYSDGTVVRWIDEAAGADLPAPTISLVASGAGTDAHGAATGDEAAAEGTDGAATGSDAAATGSEDDDDSAKTLAIVGIILGGLGLIAGVAALGLRSKPAMADAVPTTPAAGDAAHDDPGHGAPAQDDPAPGGPAH